MATIEERLRDLLDEKDAEIERMQEQINKAEEKAARKWKWYAPEEMEADPLPSLPVPRLEMRFTEIERDSRGYTVYIQYALVYRHLLGQIVRVPFGGTHTTGAVEERLRGGKLDLPFPDGAHIMHDAAHLGLPAFGVLGDHVENLRGWKWIDDVLPAPRESTPPEQSELDAAFGRGFNEGVEHGKRLAARQPSPLAEDDSESVHKLGCSARRLRFDGSTPVHSIDPSRCNCNEYVAAYRNGNAACLDQRSIDDCPHPPGPVRVLWRHGYLAAQLMIERNDALAAHAREPRGELASVRERLDEDEDEDQLPSREQARAAPCQRMGCGAKAGKPCGGGDGTWWHAERGTDKPSS